MSTANTLIFERVKKALNQVKEFGIQRDTFKMMGLDIHLRTLRGREVRESNTYVTEYMKIYEDVESAFNLDATLDFIMVRKVEVLSYGIERLGDLDLQNVEWVETGEVKSGVTIKIPKNIFVRNFLMDIDQTVVDTIYLKYADLVDLADEKSSAGITFRDPLDELSAARARVERLEKKLRADGLLEEEATPEAEEELETSSTVLTHEDVEKAMFNVLPDEGREQAFAPQEDAEPLRPLEERKEDAARTVGGTAFIRLEDPDEALSDAELAYQAAQESLFQERAGEPRQDRVPLNQVAPAHIQSGTLPSQEHTKPRVQRQSMSLPPGIDVAKGIHDSE